MKIRNLLVLLLLAIVAACSKTDIDSTSNGGGNGGSEPSQPTDPAYIELNRRLVVTDYEGGTQSIGADVDPAWEWQITTSGEEWLTAERTGNDLVITIGECSNKLQREASVTVTIGSGDNVAEATIAVLQIGTDTEELIYDVETTEANYKVVAAPILTSANGGKMTVDWGDGSTEIYESRRGAHTYATPGLYTIVISGEDIHNLEFSDGSHVCPELKRIHSWGKMGYKNALNMCKGCINLESIPADIAGSFENIGNFEASFLACESLKEIPEGLFRYAAKAKKFSNCFRYTTSLSEIPANLFAHSPLAEEFHHTFYGAGTNFKITDEALKINTGNYLNSYPAELEASIEDGKLRSLPEGLFDKCPNVTRFEYIFGATAITAIPEAIFAKNGKAEIYEGVCYACMNLQSIPAKLMKSATAATNIKYMFALCTSLTEVPTAVFENCSNVTNLEALFYLASGIRSIKKDTFKGLSLVKTIGSVFQGCTSLTDIEAGVFDGLTSAKSFPYCFADCTSLRTIPAALLSGMSAAYEFKYMFCNTALESVPETLFDEVRDYDLADYSYIFSECENLKTVPAKLFDHITDVASDGFACLFAQSGIESIPAGLFASCTNLPATAFEAAFMSCPELHTIEGSIFPETTAVTSMKQLFYDCPKLKSIPEDLFKPLGAANKLNFAYTFAGCTSLQSLPDDLFSANTKATNFQYTFSGCTALTAIPESLLSACENVTNVKNIFEGCTSLKTIPESLFASNTKIQYFESAFAGCTSLEAIPERLFIAIGSTTTAISFGSCFKGCTALKSLPAGLFDTVRYISDMSSCFKGCTALTGESPYTVIMGEKIHLYERVKSDDFPRVPSITAECFAGCTGLSDYANIPEKWIEAL